MRPSIARASADQKLKEWGHPGWSQFDYYVLCELLGLPPTNEMDVWQDKHVRACEMLCGPHGFTLYKVLLAQRGMMPEEEDK